MVLPQLECLCRRTVDFTLSADLLRVEDCLEGSYRVPLLPSTVRVDVLTGLNWSLEVRIVLTGTLELQIPVDWLTIDRNTINRITRSECVSCTSTSIRTSESEVRKKYFSNTHRNVVKIINELQMKEQLVENDRIGNDSQNGIVHCYH